MPDKLPQLVMRRPSLDDVPPVEMPAGYAVRAFRPGDEDGWNAVMDVAFDRRPGQSDFAREMAADPAYRPERVQLIADESGRVVATASCWQQARFGQDSMTLHWVGVHPGHRGRRLGWWVSLAALHHGIGEGFARAWLLTDDFRVAALRTYLRMGFTPVLAHDSHAPRWREILERLAWPERFADLLEGPLERLPGDA